MTAPHALPRLFLLVLAAVLLAWSGPAEAFGKRRQEQLTQLQSAYAAAIRWGEFEQAWEVVDPAYRQAHPLTELELSRYQQLQVSGYREIGVVPDTDGGVVRLIELRVINRNTMAERSLRYRERWRWDDQAKRWWIADGLPDFWQGQ